jgi:SAM-dependent methyltransferase
MDVNSVAAFDAEADLFDIIQAPLNRVDLPFFLSLAERAGGPMLELACGTGRVLLPCAAVTGQAVGIDLSPAMLAVARSSAAERGFAPEAVRLIEGDIRSARLDQRFPLVIMGGQPLCFLRTEADLHAALETVRAHLAPGGCWAAAMPVPVWSLLARPPRLPRPVTEIRHPVTGQRVAVWSEISGDEATQQVTRIRTTETLTESGSVVRRQTTTQHLYFRRPADIQELIRAAGFRFDELYGSYRRDPFTSRSSYLIWVASTER